MQQMGTFGMVLGAMKQEGMRIQLEAHASGLSSAPQELHHCAVHPAPPTLLSLSTCCTSARRDWAVSPAGAALPATAASRCCTSGYCSLRAGRAEGHAARQGRCVVPWRMHSRATVES